MIDTYKLNVFYGQIQVLREVSIEVKKGEFVVLLGPNGHGKSTLLKTICGLIRPTSGHVKFNGEVISDLPTTKIVEKGLVYVPEDGNLFPEMTVMENLELGAYNSNARRKKLENLDYVFSLFPKLETLKKRVASVLSGGEKRMLIIGRGLMSSAKFLAIDEPSIGLAPKIRTEMFDKIVEINKSGVTIILSEQGAVQVAQFADKIYFLEDGRVVFCGKKEDAMSISHLREVLLGVEGMS